MPSEAQELIPELNDKPVLTITCVCASAERSLCPIRKGRPTRHSLVLGMDMGDRYLQPPGAVASGSGVVASGVTVLRALA